MTKKSTLLLSLLIVTAVLATPDLPNLNINHEDFDSSNAHKLRSTAMADKARLQQLTDNVLPNSNHYAGRITELIQLSCSPQKGSILLQVPSKSLSASQKARNLHADLQDLPAGDSEPVQFLHNNLKEAALSLVQLHDGTVERENACHSAQEKLDLHSSFIQKVEDGHKEIDNRLKHIDAVISAIQIPNTIGDRDAVATDGTLSNEIKKRLNMLTDRDDEDNNEVVIADPADFYSHGNIDDLGQAYKSQIAKAANVKLAIGNLGNQIAALQDGLNNANDDGLKKSYQNKIVLHQQIVKILGDQYACEIAKAILIQICLKIKIDITVVIDILITYNNNAQGLAPGSQAYLQNLAQQYPYELQLAGLYRRNLAAEKRYQLQNNIGSGLINQLIPIYNNLQNLGVNTAPQLTTCQNQLNSLQGSNNYLQGYIPQLNQLYQNQIGKLIPYYLRLNKAGLTPGQNLQNQIATFLINAPNFAPHQLYPTAKALKNRLGQQMNVLSQCGQFLTSAGAPIPGQYLVTPAQYQMTPQIQALQNQYLAESQVVPTLNLLIQIQLRIEFLFGQLQNGQPSNLGYLEGESAPQQESPEQQAYNTQLSICGLLQIKLELLCQLLANLQNCQNNLNNGQNALQGFPQHKLAFQYGQNYAPQLANEINSLPGEISTCNNLLNNLQNQLRGNKLAFNMPQGLVINRLNNFNSLINNLENQVASARRPLVMQHIGQQINALQSGQPIQFNLIPALNSLEAPTAAQSQCVENQIQGLVSARAPHANLYKQYLQSQCGQAAALRPKLENYILQAARLNRLMPTATPTQLSQWKPQLQYYTLMGNALQNEFNLAKQIAICFQVIINLEGQLYQLLGQPNNVGQVSNLEALPNVEAGTNAGYPQQLQLCVVIKLLIQYQTSLCSALGQAPAAQLQKIHALQKVPTWLTQEAQGAPQAITECQNLAKAYRLHFANQMPVANIWSNRYQNALNRLQRIAPSNLNVPQQISMLVPQNMIPRQGENYIVNNIVGLIPQQYSANQLYPMHLKLCILIKFALENQLQQAANIQHQLQRPNLAPQLRQHLEQQLSQCQNQANALQNQYTPQRALVTNLKFYTLCNNQIQNLRSQIGQLQAPYVNNLEAIPEAVNQQIYPLQLQLCACYKIILQICIKLASTCQNASNQYPASSLVPSNLAPWLSEGQLPSAPVETQCFLNMIAICKILYGQQQPIASSLAMQLRKIPNVNQLKGQYMPYFNQLLPQLGNQAESQCGTDLQNQLASMIPASYQPQALYPQHLSLCLQVKLQLENCIQQAAQLKNQLSQTNLAPNVRQNLQNQFNTLQGQAGPLQQQYSNQFEICILLKFLTLCQSHLQNLNNQVNSLVSQYPSVGPNFLENAEGSQIPANVKQQLCQLQIQILACIKLCFQVCVPLANAISQCNNEAPSASLLPFNLRNRLTPVNLPSAGQEYPIIIQFIILLKFQLSPQQALTNSLASTLPKALSPSQVESQCNNYLQNLGTQLRGQAETECNNELQSLCGNNIPSSLTPEQLYPLHLQLCIQLRQQLENLYPQAAQLRHQLQGTNLTPAQRSNLENQLSQCQNQIGALQGQLGPQNAILITLKFIILLEGQIGNLNNQIAPLMSQWGPSALQGNVPEGVQNQICQLQIQLLACIRLKYQLCIQFTSQASQCNNSTPEQLTPFYLQGVPRNALLPTPSQAQQIGLQYIVMNKLRHQLQQSLCNQIGSQLPEAMTPSQVESECNNYLNNLRPNLANLAETQCANEIKQNLARQVPNQLVPEQAYPQHLSLCLQVKLQLEYALQNAANIQNQLQGPHLTPQQRTALQNQLVPWQNIANQLQPQYTSQKQICMLLKFLILIEGQISACNNQISSLVPNFQPGYLINQKPSNLQGSSQGPAYLTPESIPGQVQPQVYQIQLQLLACIRLKYQICSNLANALQGASNVVPQQRLSFPFLHRANLLPTAEAERQALIPFLTVCKQQQQQQQNLVNGIARLLPQGYTPEQVESQCNNYLKKLKPYLINQAETECNNEMQNMLTQNIPSNLAPEQLYPLHLSLCLQVKNALEQALQNAANCQYQLQQPNLKPQYKLALQNRLAHFQNLANQLQPQYASQKQICVLLKFLSLCGNQIQNLQNQIANLRAPYTLSQNQGPSYLSYMTAQPNIPQNIQNQITQCQIQLLACIKIKFQICIQICQAVSTCNNTPPGQSTTENVGTIPTENQVPTGTSTGSEGYIPTEYVPAGQTPTGTATEGYIPTIEGQVPTGTSTEGYIPTGTQVPTEGFIPATETVSGQAAGPEGYEAGAPSAETGQPGYVPTLPTPGQEHRCCIMICVCIKLQFELQQSLCNELGAQQPQALSPSQIKNQAQNFLVAIRPRLANQAETECNNEMQNNLASRIPASLVPENLYPQHLSLCLQIQINLQYLIQQAAPLQNQLQQKNLSPQQRQQIQTMLTPIQRQINQLQPQYTNQKAICVYLKFIILCEGQIQNLNNQIANLMPQGQNFTTMPQALQNQVFPLQLQLLACIKLKFSVCGQLCQALSQCNNTVPSNLIPSEFIPKTLQVGQLPSPAQELSACQNFATICGLKYEQQQSLCNNLGALMPQAYSPSQIRPMVNQYLVALRPRLANQAETQCANELQNHLASNIPSGFMPQALYPQMLTQCLQNKLKLEWALQRAAHLQNQLQTGNWTPQQAQALQNELTECQNLANQLQPCYANQKQFCIVLKFCIILEGQINNLNNQINNLMAPYSNNFLEAVPQSVYNQCYPLQVQLLACIKIKFQICVQLYSQCNNVSESPTSNLIPSNLIPANLRTFQVPSASQLRPAMLHFLVINKLKHNLQRNLVYALGGQMPKALTPSQVESECNNAVNNLRPQLAAQAETQCANELQNRLAQYIPAGMAPQQLYPLHLSLCAQVLNNLQHQLVRAANLAHQLQQPNLMPAQQQALQNELTQCQNLAAQLQQQYENQKNICICLKFIILCEGQINNLNNQIGQLMNQYQPSGLQGPKYGLNLSNLPLNVQQSICNLQLQLLACIKIKFQICIQLCQYVSSCNNNVPSGPGTIPTTGPGAGTESIPSSFEYVPSGQGSTENIGGTPGTTEYVPTGQGSTENIGYIPGSTPVGEAIPAGEGGPSGQAPSISETSSLPSVEGGAPTESEFPTTTYGGNGGPSGSGPGFGTLPTPGNEYNWCIQICVCIKIKFELQLSLCNNIAQQCPQALAVNQIQPRLNQLVNQFRPHMLGQAETACSNNLQSYLQSRIPSNLIPSQQYPRALRKAAALRNNLENVLTNLAQSAQPIYKLNKPESYMFQQLAPQLAQAQQLQQDYETQKNICIALQFILIIQGQLPGLVNQVNQLVGQGPSFRLQPYNLASVPANVLSQCAELQNQIAPRLRLQFQNFNNLAQAFAPYSINNLQGANMSPEFRTCVIYICILSLQQPGQLQLINALQPKLTPQQVESNCNNAAEQLRPNIYKLAFNNVVPAIQQLVPRSSLANQALRPLQLKLALQLSLCNSIQNQLAQAQNNAKALVGTPQHSYLVSLCNELQNRLNAENNIARNLYYLIPIQQNINQLSPMFVPGQTNALINNMAPNKANLANQAKLVFLTNLQHLVNTKLANEQQNAIQALTNCVNAYGNLQNNAPTSLVRNVYALQRQSALNALSECQNNYQNLANVQIPQAQSALQTQQGILNNLQSACQNQGIQNPSAIVGEAQNECKGAIAIVIDITAIIETNVNTITNVHTQGEPGNGEANVETNVHQNVATSTVGGSSFLSMRKL